MKLASMRKFRDGVCRYAKKGEMVFITNHGAITGCFLPLQHTEEVPIELKRDFVSALGHQIAASLASKKVTEKEILDDFKAFKKLAADSNVILSAVIGKAALRVFTNSSVEIVTTEFNFEEVKEYIPHLAAKYRLSREVLSVQLSVLPLKMFGESYYKDKFNEAFKSLKNRDPDDVHLAALALKENIPIWSNDKDFEVLAHPSYSTGQLLKMIV